MTVSDEQGPFYVQALCIGLNPNAAATGALPFAVRERVPVQFDFEGRSAMLVNQHRHERPTVFKTREEATRKVEELLGRVRAIVRANQRDLTGVNCGHAMALIEKDYGDGKTLGGYEILPLSTLTSEWDEDALLQERQDRKPLEHAAAEAALAQAELDRVKAEVGTMDWTADPDGATGIQIRRRSNGTLAWRYRSGKGAEPSRETRDEAIRDREAELVRERVMPT